MTDHSSEVPEAGIPSPEGTAPATAPEPAASPALQPGAASSTLPPAQPASGAPAAYGGVAPVGRVRGTGVCILLMIVTLGIYGLVWYYQTHDEMKRHSGEGLGGGIALLLAFFVGIVMPYLTSGEVGKLYERRGMKPPVSAATGLWYFPGIFILVGPFVWFIKTNGALNDYWRSHGAV